MRLFTALAVIALICAIGAGPAIAADTEDEAESAPELGFEADASLAAYAGTAALKAVEFARAEYATPLDWSDESIAELDTVMGRLHDVYRREEPDEAEIAPIAKGLGSYLGEVYRRNHGGEWGWIIEGEARTPGLKSVSGDLIWPWARALARIKSGSEFALQDYYDSLIEP